MNKQELIKTLEELKEHTKHFIGIDKYKSYWHGKTEAYVNAVGLAKQLDEPQVTAEQAWNKIAEAYPKSVQSLRNTLDNAVFGNAGEPQKPVVPKFVAEWFEKNKDDLEYRIWKYIRHLDKQDAHSDFFEWFDVNAKPIETLIRMKDGYEVEKDPLYRVKIGEGYFVEYQGKGVLIMPDKNKEIEIFDSKSEAERTSSIIGGTVEEVTKG